MLHTPAILLDCCRDRPRPAPLVVRLFAVSSNLLWVTGRKKGDAARVGTDPVNGSVEVGGFGLWGEDVGEE